MGRRPALIDAASGEVRSHAELSGRLDHLADRLGGPRALGLVVLSPDLETVELFLAFRRAGHVVMPLPPGIAPDALSLLIARYGPEWVVAPFPPGEDYSLDVRAGLAGRVWRRRQSGAGGDLHPDLAVLLATSGSTGGAKAVRLSHRAVEANAQSIVAALEIGPDDRAITTLPLSYSYGLSVLNSHLAAGAAVVLTGESLMGREFWRLAGQHGVTSLAGVPAQYQMLARLDWAALAPSSLRCLTQAGGALSPDLVRRFHALMAERGGRMFVMYGQTEATARMTVLPPQALPAAAGSVGRAVPGGAIAIEDGEIVYRGPNVMMGYATSRADLALGDCLGGVLATGDLGRIDADGLLWVTGRIKRIAKPAGKRVSLDEVELAAAGFGQVAAVEAGEGLALFVAGPLPAEADRRAFALSLDLPSWALSWHGLEALPLTASGKPDYPRLERLAEAAP